MKTNNKTTPRSNQCKQPSAYGLAIIMIFQNHFVTEKEAMRNVLSGDAEISLTQGIIELFG
jgi:hypothetical protein